MTAMDLTQPDIETHLTNLKPHIVFYDFTHWIPSVTKCLGIKALHYCTASSVMVFNEINSRYMEKINIFKGIFDSWIFLMIIFATVAAVIVEFLGAFASTVPLSWQFWLLSVLIGAISMPVAVILKCIPVERKNTTNKQHHDGYDALPSGPELA